MFCDSYRSTDQTISVEIWPSFALGSKYSLLGFIPSQCIERYIIWKFNFGFSFFPTYMLWGRLA